MKIEVAAGRRARAGAGVLAASLDAASERAVISTRNQAEPLLARARPNLSPRRFASTAALRPASLETLEGSGPRRTPAGGDLDLLDGCRALARDHGHPAAIADDRDAAAVLVDASDEQKHHARDDEGRQRE